MVRNVRPVMGPIVVNVLSVKTVRRRWLRHGRSSWSRRPSWRRLRYWHSRRRSRRGVTKVSLLGGRESASEGLTDTDGYQILAGIRYRSVSMEAQ
jgi:hypothetical protein